LDAGHFGNFANTEELGGGFFIAGLWHIPS
jgi:hypothetical protein